MGANEELITPERSVSEFKRYIIKCTNFIMKIEPYNANFIMKIEPYNADFKIRLIVYVIISP